MKKTKLLLLSSLLLAPVVFGGELPPTPEQQKALTPDGVLAELLEGNKRYVSGQLSDPNIKPRLEATTSGQHPKAIILSCIDSRVPVEQVFDQGIGDIFVGRVAGNVESVPQLGSIEYAVKVAGVKLVMVLGHEACGAVKGACDHVKLGNITGLLAEISPAVEAVEGFEKSERTSKNKDFVAAVVEKNVEMTLADIRKRSPLLAEAEKAGDIKIVGGIYSLHTGGVSLLK